MLEEYKGGINAFVHISLPDDVLVDIEENKWACQDCGKLYHQETIIKPDKGIRIEQYLPKDGHCHDCGSTSFKEGGDPISFEKELKHYKEYKDELLSFYDHYVLNLIYTNIYRGYW